MWLTGVVKKELSQNMESGKGKAGSNHSTAQSLSSPFNNLFQKVLEWPFPSYNRNVFRETPWHAVDLYLSEGGMASTSITGLMFQLRLCIKWQCVHPCFHIPVTPWMVSSIRMWVWIICVVFDIHDVHTDDMSQDVLFMYVNIERNFWEFGHDAAVLISQQNPIKKNYADRYNDRLWIQTGLQFSPCSTRHQLGIFCNVT